VTVAGGEATASYANSRPYLGLNLVTDRVERFIEVRPELVAEIEYRAWTHDGKLRHASYKGLRDAADVATVYELA
jgi:ATP-dependent DNA ligase